MTSKIYHNPRCSKSRQALQLLQERGERPEIVEYLKQPPSHAELEQLLALLGLEPRELMRRKEEEYAALHLDDPGLSREALIQAMLDHPKLIERPIVVKDGKAVLGRPPEKIVEVL
jgi:arsenate reductase (glutaredoxin)